jgi:hypothetical protein
MKTYTVIFLALFMPLALHAGELKDVKSTIRAVTVYRQGAQVERALNVSLPKGKTDIYVTNLSSKIDERSIRATAGNGQVMIVSVNFSVDYLNKQEADKEVETLVGHLQQIVDSSAMYTAMRGVYQAEKEMILANKSIGGSNTGVSVEELKANAAFFRERLAEIEMALHRNSLQQKQWMTRQQAIRQQLQTLNAQQNQPTGTVKLSVSAGQAVSADMVLTYVIDDARWVPAYDVRISDVDSPLSLFYKAQIQQNTGEEWNSVALTLSTGNPSLNNTKPDLQTYFLTFNNYYATANSIGQAARGMLSGRVIGDDGEPLPGALVSIKGTNAGTVAGADGKYSLSLPINAQMAVYSFIGYKQKELPISSSVMNVTLEEDAQLLEEVVVVGYGSISDDLQGRVAGVNAGSRNAKAVKVAIPLAIRQQQVSTEFKIDIPYTIPTDNQPYDVTMIEYTIPAAYRYSCVPKLSPDVFLIARIPDVSEYSLQNGEASLFFRGVYQGSTYIDAKAMDDTLSLSVGRDKDIAVERKIRKDYQQRRTVGSNVREQKAWDITVKNNKPIPVKITVEDQYPVSKDSDIKVEDVQHNRAKADTDTGKLTWDLTMQPRGTENIGVSYTVRYPKGRNVVVD